MAQALLHGRVSSEGQALPWASVQVLGQAVGTRTDSMGIFSLSALPPGLCTLKISAVGYRPVLKVVSLETGQRHHLEIELHASERALGEVVVSGTMKEMSRANSPVPVEVYTGRYFRSNPVATAFDALQQVNGIRPQLNCNVCNAGDIHINGLEGPYTMVLIDGMSMVSGLATVYGLFGIPQSLIERIEVVKGPASALYGSEAVAGLINVITKRPEQTPPLMLEIFGTGWGELNADAAAGFKAGKKGHGVLSANYFQFKQPIDKNGDGFTDVAQQERFSLFSKWSRRGGGAQLAARYVDENRWGGQIAWTPALRGSDSLYAETIRTRRLEVMGLAPLQKNLRLQFSGTVHGQDSYYGLTPFRARQYTGFAQLLWEKKSRLGELLFGTALRSVWYDDGTMLTQSNENGRILNRPSFTNLPGLFAQDQFHLHRHHQLLLGGRFDWHPIHGPVLTGRVNYFWRPESSSFRLRLSAGNGYRVANIFSEDHAALTGSREVVVRSTLKPERSWNVNLNTEKRFFGKEGRSAGIDATLFYTYFHNKILPDFDSDPNRIFYDNLPGYGISRGVTLNLDTEVFEGLRARAGATLMDVFSLQHGVKTRPLFTERFSGVWGLSYVLHKPRLSIDYTGNLYSPMRLPLLSALDPRNPYSPWWSIQNVQLTWGISEALECFGGVKNLLNWTPNRGNPFLIARAHDPFDKNVRFDGAGQALSTPENPYALTFDPGYVYAPNQGRRLFLGIRFRVVKGQEK